MKKHFIYILGVFFSLLVFSSCKTNEIKKQELGEIVIKNPQSVEDYIKDLVKKGQTIQNLDLSGKELTEVPDLSKLEIVNLDLSNNRLSSIDYNKLPKNLNSLDLSNNIINGKFHIKSDSNINIDTLNISHNNLEYIAVDVPIYKLDVSHNDATIVSFDHSNIEYLDISYNKKHSNLTEFDPYLIKTIIREGIANDEPLKAKWRGIIKD